MLSVFFDYLLFMFGNVITNGAKNLKYPHRNLRAINNKLIDKKSADAWVGTVPALNKNRSVFFLKIFLLDFLYSKDYFVPLHIQN